MKMDGIDSDPSSPLRFTANQRDFLSNGNMNDSFESSEENEKSSLNVNETFLRNIAPYSASTKEEIRASIQECFGVCFIPSKKENIGSKEGGLQFAKEDDRTQFPSADSSELVLDLMSNSLIVLFFASHLGIIEFLEQTGSPETAIEEFPSFLDETASIFLARFNSILELFLHIYQDLKSFIEDASSKTKTLRNDSGSQADLARIGKRGYFKKKQEGFFLKKWEDSMSAKFDWITDLNQPVIDFNSTIKRNEALAKTQKKAEPFSEKERVKMKIHDLQNVKEWVNKRFTQIRLKPYIDAESVMSKITAGSIVRVPGNSGNQGKSKKTPGAHLNGSILKNITSEGGFGTIGTSSIGLIDEEPDEDDKYFEEQRKPADMNKGEETKNKKGNSMTKSDYNIVKEHGVTLQKLRVCKAPFVSSLL